MNSAPLILAIETSCDDTSAAVVRATNVLSNIISSQSIHDLYGGIVPELASREHMVAIAPIVEVALCEAGYTVDDVDAIAVTNGPGLPGSLIVGTHYAKGLALRHGKPLLPVQHIDAHVYSAYLEDPTLSYPSICLVVSGGHTSIMYVRDPAGYSVLGSTRDDAAGEAFDKVAKLLGLGYPGGPHIDRLAKEGRADGVNFPRGLMHDGSYDFSFSGLKTAVRNHLKDPAAAKYMNNVCASVQRAIVDVLVAKTMRAADEYNVRAVCIAGGVSANTELRARMHEACDLRDMRFVAPRMEYCVDNAAMIGFVAGLQFERGERGRPFTIQPRGLRS